MLLLVMCHIELNDLYAQGHSNYALCFWYNDMNTCIVSNCKSKKQNALNNN